MNEKLKFLLKFLLVCLVILVIYYILHKTLFNMDESSPDSPTILYPTTTISPTTTI